MVWRSEERGVGKVAVPHFRLTVGSVVVPALTATEPVGGIRPRDVTGVQTCALPIVKVICCPGIGETGVPVSAVVVLPNCTFSVRPPLVLVAKLVSPL